MDNTHFRKCELSVIVQCALESSRR